MTRRILILAAFLAASCSDTTGPDRRWSASEALQAATTTCTLTLLGNSPSSSNTIFFTGQGPQGSRTVPTGAVLQVYATPANFLSWVFTPSNGNPTTNPINVVCNKPSIKIQANWKPTAPAQPVVLTLNDSAIVADESVYLTLQNDGGAAAGCTLEGLSPTNFSWHWGLITGAHSVSVFVPRLKGYNAGTYDFFATCYDNLGGVVGRANVRLTVSPPIT